MWTHFGVDQQEVSACIYLARGVLVSPNDKNRVEANNTLIMPSNRYIPISASAEVYMSMTMYSTYEI